MKLASKIFKRNDWYVTSAFGYRKDPISNKQSFHSGTDYGTKSQKWNQYAIENGVVLSCGIATDGAKFVWVNYPRINKKLLHYHLDSVNVRKGQAVNSDTILGATGTTGYSTGIHLHLGMQNSAGGAWLDPHAYNYEEAPKPQPKPPTPQPQPKPNVDMLDLVRKTIRGDFGNGADRKKALGSNYEAVQKQVNLNKQNGTTQWGNIRLY